MTISIPTTLISEGFATGDGSKTYPVPVASQIGITPGAASFTDGFPPLTRTALGAGGIPPSGEDMNGILYQITQLLAWSCSGGFYQYNSTQSAAIGGYPVGAILQSSDGASLWLNLTANNTGNPDSGSSTGWLPLASLSAANPTLSSGTVTLTPDQFRTPLIVFTGTLTGNVVVNFPAISGKLWVVANYATMNGHTITLQTATAGSSTVISTAGGYPSALNVFSDGVNLYCNNVSVAGLAPLASPALTGTPTAPTAPNGSDTTQIATTQYVVTYVLGSLAAYAPLASPVLSGNPTCPTQAAGANNATLANTAFVTAAVAAGGGSASIASNGYQKFPSGVILQWGFAQTPGYGTITVNFPIAFPHACFSITCSTNRTSSGSSGYNYVTILSASQFEATFDLQSNGYSGGYWMAIGY